MKSVASLIIIVILLVVTGTVLWFASQTEARVAAAEYALVTLRYERAAQELDEARGRGVLEPLMRRLSGDATDSSLARYWSGDYASLAEAEDARLKLLATDAEYRMLRSTGGTYQAFVARLDSISKRYADVLRSDPTSEDAAYNYEFTLRLRRAALAAKQTIPGLEPAAGITVHGVPGAPPPDSDAKKFKMIVPMMPDERQEAEEAGRTAKKIRKG